MRVQGPRGPLPGVPEPQEPHLRHAAHQRPGRRQRQVRPFSFLLPLFMAKRGPSACSVTKGHELADVCTFCGAGRRWRVRASRAAAPARACRPNSPTSACSDRYEKKYVLIERQKTRRFQSTPLGEPISQTAVVHISVGSVLLLCDWNPRRCR